ncbi:MAG: AAA family ATPase [Methanomassiliicoccaceae archaeon]|nr:AAA family ATPase [Methanomassiliicoccaceae archaeon]
MSEDEPLIDRPAYVDEIRGFIDKPLIKVITGVRRSGKSKLLKLIQKEISERADHGHVIEMNFETSEFFDIKGYVELAKYSKGV